MDIDGSAAEVPVWFQPVNATHETFLGAFTAGLMASWYSPAEFDEICAWCAAGVDSPPTGRLKV